MRKRMGFTIVELLVVIVVIAILATISVVAYINIQGKAHTAVTATNIKTYVSGLNMMQIDQDHYWVDSAKSMQQVCIGVSAQSGEDCGTNSYQGSGCSEFGITPGSTTAYDITYSDEFNDTMKQYLGTVPRSVQTSPATITQEIAGCTVTLTLRGATYKSASYINVSKHGIGYGSNNGNNGAAYVIQYAVPENDCLVPGAKSYATLFPNVSQAHNGTVCYLFSGNVTYSN